MRKLLASLLCAVMLLGLLSGCGTSDEPAGDESSPAPAEQEETAAPPGDESGSAPAPEETEEARAAENETTTLMIYMIGADLESEYSEATNDLEEILGSGAALETTRILVCAGGTEQWHLELMDPGSETLLRLTAEGYEKLGSLPLQSMGEPACLAAFLNYCVEHYPAEHYALILWDHGNGPVMGCGQDTLFGKDSLTLSEMRQAMEQTPFAGELRLDWVGFDACLMASAELACVWQDYADILISSQETEPFFGWNYAFLASCGTLSPRALSCRIADAYLSYAEDYFAQHAFFQSDVTLSVLDLSQAGELEAAVNALFRAAAEDVSGGFVRLARARIGVRAIGRAATGSDYDLVDLQALAENMKEAYPRESEALLAALEETVIHSVSNTSQCCGLSLYYPYYNKDYYQSFWKETYRELAVFPEYLNYLERYEQLWMGTDMQRFFSGSLELQEGDLASTYTLQLSPEQAEVYAWSEYYILRRETDDLYTLVYYSDDLRREGQTLTAEFDGRVFYYGSDAGRSDLPFFRMWDTVNGITDYSVYVVLLRGSFLDPDCVTLPAEICFSAKRESGEMQIKGIFPWDEESDFSGGKRLSLDLSDWETIRFFHFSPRYLVRDENGRIASFWDWPESRVTTWGSIPVADHPKFSFEPLYDDGHEYFILINVSDVQGSQYRSELFPVRLALAPETEPAPAVRLSWDEGTDLRLLEKDGVSVGLAAASVLEDGQLRFFLTGSNQNDYTVDITLEGDDALANGALGFSTGSLGRLRLEPGASGRVPLSKLSAAGFLSGEGRLRSLVCGCSVKRHDDSSTIFSGRFDVELSEGLSFPLRWDELLGAQAAGQPLLEEAGLRVSLLGLGSPLSLNPDNDGKDLKASLCVSNRSGEDKTVELIGLLINDTLFRTDASMTLADGQDWYPLLRVSTSLITPTLATSSRSESGKIETISLSLRIDGEQRTCPVVLGGSPSASPESAEPQPEDGIPAALPESGTDAGVFPLVQREDFRLELILSRDPQSAAVKLWLRLVKLQEDEAYYQISDLILNDRILLDAAYRSSRQLDERPWELDAAPLFAQGILSPDGLRQFSCRVQKRGGGGEILWEERCAVQIPESFRPGFVFLPCLDARAERQVLLDNDRVLVTLEGMGTSPAQRPGSLSFLLRAENRSDRTLPLKACACAVNGAYCDRSSDTFSLAPGAVCYLYTYLLDSDLSGQDISAIDSVSLRLLTDSSENLSPMGWKGGAWYPVALSESGQGGGPPEVREILYENQWIRIGFVGWEERAPYYAGDTRRYTWTLVVWGVGDKNLYLFQPDEEDGYYLSNSEIGAGFWTLVKVNVNVTDGTERPQLTIRLRGSEIERSIELFADTGPIPLPNE